ncbi:putative SseB domain protein [Campylobacter pinnipediorum subsp. pinnipediorum]|uniref:SseB family protein n=1 Tax=Campylobacter pinnipediorum TaxID=1965231 RepID=UPI0009C1AAF8|nr:SseB family protein [Campylobacter pinnipediorum]AQW80854.1 putative SseB domain protein [Campylobacter pinnipediorum subsp. pinnipediorum]OPA74514.1 transporter [Campylobacter pinnipediorum subsp. pinnipediorum]
MNLKDAMDKFLKNPVSDNERNLIDILKTSEFLSPIMLISPMVNKDGSSFDEEEGNNIRFVILEDEDTDKKYYPLFTSQEEMLKWRKDEEQESIKLKLKDYTPMLLSEKNEYDGIVIDPFSHSLILNLKFLESVFK